MICACLIQKKKETRALAQGRNKKDARLIKVARFFFFLSKFNFSFTDRGAILKRGRMKMACQASVRARARDWDSGCDRQSGGGAAAPAAAASLWRRCLKGSVSSSQLLRRFRLEC